MSTTDKDNPYASHWHVITHAEDEDTFITYDTVAALDYAATEVDEHAENEHGNAWDSFKVKSWEESATAFVTSERYGILARNMRVVVRNAALSPADRAPLYHHEGQYGPLWTRSFEHVMDTFRSASPSGLNMWECHLHECRPGAWQVRTWGDFSPYKILAAFPAIEYTDAYNRYASEAQQWADQSDEDYWTDEGDGGTDRATVDDILADQQNDQRNAIEGAVMTIHSNHGETIHFALMFDPTHELEN